MPNRSHYNSAHRMMNYMNRTGIKHSSEREAILPNETMHAVIVSDVLDLLPEIPDQSIDLIVCDPPYNLDIATWDSFGRYVDWAAKWLEEIPRLLADTGNFVIFGGMQFQDEKGGDLLELIQYLRKNSPLRMVNFIVWHYKSGMSAHRFFANRHEEIVWFSKTKKYTFNLDDVRIRYDKKTLEAYLRDPRLNPDNVRKGKNPGNVWDIPRLNANAKERVGHPTQKPVAVIERLVKGLSNPGDIVLDFFAGSGTTTRVCIEQGRHSIAADVDPKLSHYLDAHLSQLDGRMPRIPYRLLPEEEWRTHPVFMREQIQENT